MIEDAVPLGKVINEAFDSIESGEAAARGGSEADALGILRDWKAVVGGIKSRAGNPEEGANIGSHSRVVDLKRGILFVEVDHPGWMALIKLHKNYILKGLRLKNPKAKIKSIAFYLKKRGEDDAAEDISEIRKRIQMRAEEEERRAASAYSTKKSAKRENSVLPAELEAAFGDLRKSMLTDFPKK